jgi:hypothetical protein
MRPVTKAPVIDLFFVAAYLPAVVKVLVYSTPASSQLNEEHLWCEHSLLL